MSITSTLTLTADTVGSAHKWLTHQRVTGSSPPAPPTQTASIHTFAVSAAVCWLASLMDTQYGGDIPSTAPPIVRFAGEAKKEWEDNAKKDKHL